MTITNYLIKKGLLHHRDIIIIDADRESRELQCRLLSEQGANVITTATFAEGFTAMGENENIELIIIDTTLPNISNVDVIEKIREDDRFILTPVLVVTNDYEKCNQLELFQLGITKFLAKPFFEDALVLAIMEVLPKKDYS
jgi:CheY-like chemotaxis protein